MLTYEDAAQMMKGARNGRRKLGNNTYLEERQAGQLMFPCRCAALGGPGGPHYAIRLHRTDVVTLHPDGSQTLDSGGWRTVTTKDRINVHSIAQVWSENRAWKAAVRIGHTWSADHWFTDGMRVYPGGRVAGAEPVNADWCVVGAQEGS